MLSLIALAAGNAMARPADYRLDPVHSRIAFSVQHLGFSSAIGTFSRPRGWLHFDPDDWRSARAEIEIDLASLDLGDADWNARLARKDGFDSGAFPLARFRSTAVRPVDARHFTVEGLLTLRGQDHPVRLEVRFNRLARHPLTLRRTAGFSATARLSRSALGLTAWKSMVGDEVELRVEVEAQRKRRPATNEPGGDHATP